MKQSKKKERKAWTREKKIRTFIVGISTVLLLFSYLHMWKAQHDFEVSFASLPVGDYEGLDAAREKRSNAHMTALWIQAVAVILTPVCEIILHIDREKWLYWLPNRYRIRKIEDEYIVLERVCGEITEQILPDCIAVFCRNERYVCVQTGIPGKKQRRKKDKDIPDTLDRTEYYILDTEAHQTYGPYYPWNFQIECHALGVGEIGKWIPTKPRPEFADPIFWEKPNGQ